MASAASICSTHGSRNNRAPTPKSLNSHSEPSAKYSTTDKQELSTSRVADYLEYPTASHMHPRHTSSQESTRLLEEKKSFLKALDDKLSANQK
ncbi:hypothetical protein N431DRAFT_472482 [Stipitochalara longipes BDJ]|nr:hypothetical protein N431DRAFT_472482 [Stipitochalara longipes BDJ]